MLIPLGFLFRFLGALDRADRICILLQSMVNLRQQLSSAGAMIKVPALLLDLLKQLLDQLPGLLQVLALDSFRLVFGEQHEQARLPQWLVVAATVGNQQCFLIVFMRGGKVPAAGVDRGLSNFRSLQDLGCGGRVPLGRENLQNRLVGSLGLRVAAGCQVQLGSQFAHRQPRAGRKLPLAAGSESIQMRFGFAVLAELISSLGGVEFGLIAICPVRAQQVATQRDQAQYDMHIFQGGEDAHSTSTVVIENPTVIR